MFDFSIPMLLKKAALVALLSSWAFSIAEASEYYWRYSTNGHLQPIYSHSPNYSSAESACSAYIGTKDGVYGSYGVMPEGWRGCMVYRSDDGTFLGANAIGRFGGECPSGQVLNASGTACGPDCHAPYTAMNVGGSMQCAASCGSANASFSPGTGCSNPPNQTPPNNCSVGNPIVIFSGEKTQKEVPDYSTNTPLGVRFQRNYNSQRAMEWRTPETRPSFINTSASLHMQPSGFQGVGGSLTTEANPEKPKPKTGFQPMRHEGWTKVWPRLNNNEVNYNVPYAGYKQWRHNYQYRLIESTRDAKPVLIWVRPEGENLILFETQSGVYADKNFANTSAKLDEVHEEYVIDVTPSIRHKYNLEGLLTRIESGDAYNDLSYNELEQLVSVADSYGQEITFTYLNDLTQLNTVNFPNGVVLLHRYDGVGNVIKVTKYVELNGEQEEISREYQYDNSEYHYALTGIIDAEGNQFAIWKYDEDGRAYLSAHGADGLIDKNEIIRSDTYYATINPLGRETRYNYQELNGVKRITSVEGVQTNTCAAAYKNFEYYENGLQKLVTDWEGSQTYYEYIAGTGFKSKQIEAYGTSEARTTIYEWDQAKGVITKITQGDRVLEYIFDEHGRLESSLLNGERLSYIQYNDYGLPVLVDGPRKDVLDTTRYTYYTSSNLLASVTNALGHVTQYEDYTSEGFPQKIISPNSVVTRYKYNSLGLVESIITDEGGKNLNTRIEYDKNSQVKKIISPAGDYSVFEYDDAQRNTTITNNFGEKLSYELDVAGNITKASISDSSNNLSQQIDYVYDELSRLKEVLEGGATIGETYNYDKNDRPLEAIDAKHLLPQKNTYDALGRLKKIIDRNQGVTQFEYDNQDNLVLVVDPEGVETSYEYDLYGNLIKQISADTGVTEFTHDLAGNVLTEIDAVGIVASYTYDALNRVTSIEYPNAPEENVSYEYDSLDFGPYSIGKLTKVTDASGTVNFIYDALGNVTQKKHITSQNIYGLQYGYDDLGRLSTVQYPSGNTVSYTYDSLNRVKAVFYTQVNEQAPKVVIDNIEYLPFGPAKSWTYGNGVAHSLEYDTAYRVKGIDIEGQNTVLARLYEYDANNNIQSFNGTVRAQDNTNYSYDVLDRLIYSSGVFGDIGYTYDDIGNRLTREHETGAESISESYSYSETSHRLTSVSANNQSTVQFSYDENGNVTQKIKNTTENYIYNDRNRLVQADVENGTFNYTYNSFGQRVIKNGAGLTQHFLFGLRGQLMAEINQAGRSEKEYIWFAGHTIALIQNSEQVAENILLEISRSDSPSVVYFGNKISLLAEAEKDGVDISSEVVWWSDLDGELGQGAEITDIQLSTGMNTITAVVSDVNGAITSQSMLINVRNNYSPTINTPTSSLATRYALKNEPVTLSASAYDYEDGELSQGIQWSSSLMGSIGGGETVTTVLNVGLHNVTIKVADTQGAVAEQTLAIHIVDSSDSDNDGLSDDWEVQHFGDLIQTGNQDFDADGLTNIEELQAGTDPVFNQVDTDLDGLLDEWEVTYFGDLSQTPMADPDLDGYSNADEFASDTNPALDEFKNYWNPNRTHGNMNLSEGNRRIGSNYNSRSTSQSIAPLYRGKKYYWEVKNIRGTSSMVGIAPVDIALTAHLATEPYTYGLYNNGSVFDNQVSTANAGPVYSAGKTVMIAFDPDAGKLWFGVDGVWFGNPANNTGATIEGITHQRGLFYPSVSHLSDDTRVAFSLGDFQYQPPAGFGPSQIEDWDDDGLSDRWEIHYFGDSSHNGNDDIDGDGISNAQEMVLNLDPTDGVIDSDSDGMIDSWELQYFSSLGAAANDDSDLDGLSNLEEFNLQADPTFDQLANHWNPATTHSRMTLSNNNRTVHSSNVSRSVSLAKGALYPGKKYYWEVTINSGTSAYIGIADNTVP
ncbi:SPRY domain-containing protein, partial [Saccharophagus degradans]|nr:hypothetical protein [Saccharophagus degradans]MDO6607595.1 hypothetical protein [Saccharophagus degradans]